MKVYHVPNTFSETVCAWGEVPGRLPSGSHGRVLLATRAPHTDLAVLPLLAAWRFSHFSSRKYTWKRL